MINQEMIAFVSEKVAVGCKDCQYYFDFRSIIQNADLDLALCWSHGCL